MTNHGFGGGKIKSRKIDPKSLDAIAQCISNVPGVTWSHVVHQGSKYVSGAEKLKMRAHEDGYDLIWEMKHHPICDLEAIVKCTKVFAGADHNIEIDVFTVKDKSYEHGNPGKHPKTID